MCFPFALAKHGCVALIRELPPVGDIDCLSIAGGTPEGPFHIEYRDRTHDQTFLATTLNGSYVRLRRPNAICDISNCTKLDNLYAGP